MRPVEKRSCTLVFADHKEAAPELKKRLGAYCSFCERFIAAAIEVEHKKPKNEYPRERLSWDNFLLACKNCNSTKAHGRMRLHRYFWPDTDNTFRAIIYKKGGFVDVNDTLPRYLRRRASRTIQLTGLNRHPARKWKKEPYSPKDDRWLHREQAWKLAEIAKKQIVDRNTDEMRDFAVLTALQRGFFSIWMTVFADDPEMKKRLIIAFTGTAPTCFDSNGDAIARVGGQI